MTDTFDIDLASASLIEAWRSGGQLTALPATARPRTLCEGYDVQDRFVAAIDSGFAGWKLGVGSHKAKLASGVGRSIAGRVLRSCVFEPGDVVPLPSNAPVTIELEVAFVLGRDVLPGDAIDDPLALVAEVRLTAELVLSRFEDRRSVGWPSFAADNAGFQALVVGPAIRLDDLEEIRRTLVVEVDGRERVRAATGEDMTDPTQAFVDLLAHARERGVPLAKSSIVSTGSQSTPFPITGAAAIVARCAVGEFAFSTVLPRRQPALSMQETSR